MSNLSSKDLDHPFLSQIITLVCYIDDIMVIRPSEQDITLDSLVTHMHIRECEINTTLI